MATEKLIEDPPRVGTGFDMRVHIRNAITGEVIKHQPYSLHVVSGVSYFERPPGSGNVFFGGEAGPAGRWVNGAFVKDAPHIAVKPKAKSADVENENEALRKEIAQMRAEREEKAKGKRE